MGKGKGLERTKRPQRGERVLGQQMRRRQMPRRHRQGLGGAFRSLEAVRWLKSALRLGAGLLGLGASWACNPLQLLECREQTTEAQEVLLNMNDQAIDEVRRAKMSVDQAVEACRSVAAEDDLARLQDAQSQLQTQIAGLLRRQSLPSAPKLNSDELMRLEKKGDPTCPRGQQYQHPQKDALIRCVGPQVVEMNWSEAVEHYAERRGFSKYEEGPVLKFEFGAQVTTFRFARAGAQQAAECIEIIGEPGISWQELVARATGVQPRRLKKGQAVPGPSGPLLLRVDESTDQAAVFLGQCDATAGQ